MPHSVSLINTIAAGLGLALVLGFIAARLRLPPLVGYLLAGVIVGPFTPGFVADRRARRAAGRDRRHPADVRRRPALLARRPAGGAQRIAMPGALVQIAVADAARHRGRRTGWGWSLGAGAGVRPGAVGREHRGAAARARSRGICSTPITGRIAVGWLIVEDLVMVLVLVLLPPLGAASSAAAGSGAGARRALADAAASRC